MRVKGTVIVKIETVEVDVDPNCTDDEIKVALIAQARHDDYKIQKHYSVEKLFKQGEKERG